MTAHKPSAKDSSQGRTYRVIGSRAIRAEDAEKISGQAIFGEDFRLPGMLYGAVLRSPHAHARILSIDTRQAEALAGVRAVITAADFPPLNDDQSGRNVWNSGERYNRDNRLASNTVLYNGHAIAAVAATSPHIAAEALDLIKVEYEILPHVLDVQAAMQAGAPILHPELRTEGEAGDSGETNVESHVRFKRGDVEKAFAQAQVVVEREFHTASVHQGYIEPQNATALFTSSGQLTLWTSTQGSFTARQQTAELQKSCIFRLTASGWCR